MNAERILKISLEKLKDFLPDTPEHLYHHLCMHPEQWTYEGSDLSYCLFTFPVYAKLRRCVLLVYDKDEIIADMSGYIGIMNVICHDQKVMDAFMEESDWMDLEQYILKELYGNDDNLDTSPCFLVTNAYVSMHYRRRHIFMKMENMIHDFILQHFSGSVVYYSVISLDPDVACYGPDTVNEPYVYSYEKDEPARMRNRNIIEKIGYRAIRLETDETGDGTKIWFAVKKEADEVLYEADA